MRSSRDRDSWCSTSIRGSAAATPSPISPAPTFPRRCWRGQAATPRCRNGCVPNRTYGGRGTTVCSSWMGAASAGRCPPSRYQLRRSAARGETHMTCRVAIIGAGPYGLAAAAHLRAANVETHVFGQPMCFWEQQMPAGMFLRSPVSASHISDPGDDFTLDRYSETEQTPLSKPIPLRRFVEYGRWFQSNVVPDLDRRRVERVERIAG